MVFSIYFIFYLFFGNQFISYCATNLFVLIVLFFMSIILFVPNAFLSYFFVLFCLIYLKNLIYFFNWRIIALQNFVLFCQTSTWISHRCIYIYIDISPLCFEPPSHLPLHLTLLVDTEPLFEFPESYSKFPFAIYFTYGNISFHVTLSIHLTLSSPFPVSISLFRCMNLEPIIQSEVSQKEKDKYRMLLLSHFSRVRLCATP